jgi:hypothetical protein
MVRLGNIPERPIANRSASLDILWPARPQRNMHAILLNESKILQQA